MIFFIICQGSEALFSTCFPGCEVPSWFGHEAVGSLLQRKLLPHWHDKRLSGIALCAVVSFPDSQDQLSCFSVTCTFKIKAEDKSWVPFTCPVGIWTREGNKKDRIESDHVFIAYISSPHSIRCLEEKNSDKCNFSEASLEFTVTSDTSGIGVFKVLKCGLSLVYENDKNKNSSLEAKYDVPVEVSFQEPEHGIMEEERYINKRRSDDRRPKKKRKTKRDDIMIISTVTQTCVPSVNARIEDKVTG
jgi:hypothetical protein